MSFITFSKFWYQHFLKNISILFFQDSLNCHLFFNFKSLARLLGVEMSSINFVGLVIWGRLYEILLFLLKCLFWYTWSAKSIWRDSIIRDPRFKIPRSKKSRSRKFKFEKFRSEKSRSEEFRSRKFRSKKSRSEKSRSRKFRSEKFRNLDPRNLDLSPRNIDPRNLDPRKLHGLDQIK